MTRPVRRSLCIGLTLAGAVAAVPGIARAQAWPTRPLKIVVPYPAGGAPDATARRIAEKLSAQLGQPVVVENKPGGSAVIGAKAVSAAPADGYTLLYLSSAHATVQAISGRLDLQKEFAPIARTGTSPFIAVVNASSPYTTLGAFLEAARAQPGKFTYGTAGVGSPAHIAVERIRERVPGLDLLQVPFKGAVESANALAGGQIDFSVSVLGAVLPHLKSGRLRALAITTPERVGAVPDVPTMVEAGVAGYAFDAWGGFAAPAGTPDEIVLRLHAAIAKGAAEPDFKAYADSVGQQVSVSASPQAFAKEIAETIARERETVGKLGLKAG